MLSRGEDAATTMAVAWRGGGSGVQIAPALPGPDLKDGAISVEAESEDIETDSGTWEYHSAVFTDLKPETTYAYRVGSGIHWSPWTHFTTAAAGAKPFSFIYLGDLQNGVRSHCRRVVHAAYREAPDAAFMLQAGDLVNRGNEDDHWDGWFESCGWLVHGLPLVPVLGNHETHVVTVNDKKHYNQTPPLWKGLFALPDNGPEGLEDTAYWFDYQGVRFVVLNSNHERDKQAAWLDDVLAGRGDKWSIVSMHHPVYPSAVKRGTGKGRVRDAFQPVFDRRGVDLVLQGHDHSYMRTGLMRHDPEIDEHHVATESDTGTVYVNSVVGSKQYDVATAPFKRRTGQNLQLYQVIHIDGDALHYRAYTADGNVYDEFKLEKQRDGTNRLIEQRHGIGENLQPGN
ncbi:MAG: metallophosphoesterase [Planctomycetes bacterium]|nr:metallophosphoesterase [Planctomycetota bacterium]